MPYHQKHDDGSDDELAMLASPWTHSATRTRQDSAMTAGNPALGAQRFHKISGQPR
jgi:hypothetical protein